MVERIFDRRLSAGRKGAFSMQKRFGCLLLALMIFCYAALPGWAAASGSDVTTAVSAADTVTSPSAAPPQTQERPDTQTDVLETTASQIAGSMNLGWNLGDSLDAWARDAGYDEYHNANAYQMVLRYDDANHERATSIAVPFDKNNKCTYKWATGLITSDPSVKLGLSALRYGIWRWKRKPPSPSR